MGENHVKEREQTMKKHIKTIVALIAGALAFAVGFTAFAQSLKSDIDRELAADKPSAGVGRMYTADVLRYAAVDDAGTVGTCLRVYCETDEDLPEWWDPEGAQVVYTAPEPKRDIGAPDWNLNTTLWGWDGHGMEVWEFDLFVRIVYLEFWGTSHECVEAGIDSMLLLWDMGEYGRTMGELLSAQYAPGYYVYSPYAYVWDWQYDAQGLADIRAMCEERFQNGPTWCAPYFRLWYYHDWATPAYEIDGVYFSVPGAK